MTESREFRLIGHDAVPDLRPGARRMRPLDLARTGRKMSGTNCGECDRVTTSRHVLLIARWGKGTITLEILVDEHLLHIVVGFRPGISPNIARYRSQLLG